MGIGGCNLTGYGPFQKVVLDTDPTSVLNASHIEFVIDEAHKLVIFTGEAIVNFLPTDDNTLTRGVLSIVFNYDLLDASNLLAGAASATLASVFNNDTSYSFTYAIDCVDVRFILIGQLINGQFVITTAWPMLVMAIVVEGAGGHTGLTRVSYQANLQLKAQLQLLVAEGGTLGPPGAFVPILTIPAGDPWVFQVTLPGPAGVNGAVVSLSSDNPGIANVQSQITMPFQQVKSDPSPPQISTGFHNPSSIDVHITATFGTLHSTATLHILAIGP